MPLIGFYKRMSVEPEEADRLNLGGWTNSSGKRIVRRHRLVWARAHGPTPQGFVIDHINGERDDDRLENLRAIPENFNRRWRARRGGEHRRRFNNAVVTEALFYSVN